MWLAHGLVDSSNLCPTFSSVDPVGILTWIGSYQDGLGLSAYTVVVVYYLYVLSPKAVSPVEVILVVLQNVVLFLFIFVSNNNPTLGPFRLTRELVTV